MIRIALLTWNGIIGGIAIIASAYLASQTPDSHDQETT